MRLRLLSIGVAAMLAATIGSGMGLPSPVSAQDNAPVRISVSPGENVDIDTGQNSITVPVKLKNEGTEAVYGLTVQTALEQLAIIDASDGQGLGGVVRVNGSRPQALGVTTTIARSVYQKSIDLLPGKEIGVTTQVSIPTTIRTGSYYLSLSVFTRDGGSVASATASIPQELQGNNTFLSVDPTAPYIQSEDGLTHDLATLVRVPAKQRLKIGTTVTNPSDAVQKVVPVVTYYYPANLAGSVPVDTVRLKEVAIPAKGTVKVEGEIPQFEKVGRYDAQLQFVRASDNAPMSTITTLHFAIAGASGMVANAPLTVDRAITGRTEVAGNVLVTQGQIGEDITMKITPASRLSRLIGKAAVQKVSFKDENLQSVPMRLRTFSLNPFADSETYTVALVSGDTVIDQVSYAYPVTHANQPLEIAILVAALVLLLIILVWAGKKIQRRRNKLPILIFLLGLAVALSGMYSTVQADEPIPTSVIAGTLWKSGVNRQANVYVHNVTASAPKAVADLAWQYNSTDLYTHEVNRSVTTDIEYGVNFDVTSHASELTRCTYIPAGYAQLEAAYAADNAISYLAYIDTNAKQIVLNACIANGSSPSIPAGYPDYTTALGGTVARSTHIVIPPRFTGPPPAGFHWTVQEAEDIIEIDYLSKCQRFYKAYDAGVAPALDQSKTVDYPGDSVNAPFDPSCDTAAPPPAPGKLVIRAFVDNNENNPENGIPTGLYSEGKPLVTAVTKAYLLNAADTAHDPATLALTDGRTEYSATAEQANGTYFVFLDLPSNYDQTTFVSGTTDSDGQTYPGVCRVKFVPGSTAECNFGLHARPTSTTHKAMISGLIFKDGNQDGSFDPGEPQLTARRKVNVRYKLESGMDSFRVVYYRLVEGRYVFKDYPIFTGTGDSGSFEVSVDNTGNDLTAPVTGGIAGRYVEKLGAERKNVSFNFGIK